MRFLVAILICLFACLVPKAQQCDSFLIKVNVSAVTDLRFNPRYVYSVEKNGNSLKLRYTVMDSVRKAFYQDERVKSLLETIISRYKQAATFDSIFTMKMDSLRALEMEYAHCTSDSVFVNVVDYLSFTDVLKKIIITPKEKLEDLEADKKLHVADGAYFSFQIQTKYEKKIVNSFNLDATLHPSLYQLLTEILDIYKGEKGKNFPN